MSMTFIEDSATLFAKACSVIPGGVNSPVRAFHAVQHPPLVIKKAEGPYITTVEGQTYIDCIGAWGPAILGHAHSTVTQVLQEKLKDGFSFGLLHKEEILLAETICKHHPAVEKVRLTCSGTEAVMTALRLARAYTKRPLILKFAGGYHGHADGLLVKSGSGLATYSLPASEGVPTEIAQLTLTLPFNNLQALENILKQHAPNIAALIAEPIPANMGVVPPLPGYWENVQALLKRHNILLIWDEVITGYRVNLGSAQALYNIRPDLVTFGKIIAGGLPGGAVGGRADIMNLLAPLGPVYQAGTLAGNPLSVAAGLATLQELERLNPYQELTERTQNLAKTLHKSFTETHIPVCIHHAPGLLTVFFTDARVENYADVESTKRYIYPKFFKLMLDQGVLLPPSAFEAWFFSVAHTQEIFDTIANAAIKAIEQLKAQI